MVMKSATRLSSQTAFLCSSSLVTLFFLIGKPVSAATAAAASSYPSPLLTRTSGKQKTRQNQFHQTMMLKKMTSVALLCPSERRRGDDLLESKGWCCVEEGWALDLCSYMIVGLLAGHE
eukprot:jgi/Bigna1/64516/fgenesh1_kg.77_\